MKKLLAILLVLAMIPTMLIPAFADESVKTETIYDLTFDNSGDEAAKLAEWGTSDYPTSFTSEGYLALGKCGGWKPIKNTAGTINPTTTFTASVTYRHTTTPDSNAHAVALMFGSNETVAFRAFPDKSWLGDVVPDGAIPMANWGDPAVAWGYAMISPEYMNAMAQQKWITITLDVKNGVPASVTFASEGLEDLTFNYQGQGNISGLNAKDFAVRFKTASVDLYDLRVVAGTDLGLTNAMTSKVEMVGVQKHNTKGEVRVIAKVDADVKDVKFALQASRNGEAGKYYVSEAISLGYTSYVADGVTVTAEDGKLFVMFVIKDLDFNAYDYDFTVNAIAGNAQCFAKTYTVK